MKQQTFSQILAGLIFFCVCNLGYSNPASDKDSINERNQNEDDYQYSDDESVPSNTKLIEPSPSSAMVPFFSTNNITIKTIAGKTAVLDCPVNNFSDQNVVLWYKDNNNNLITTGAEVLKDDYILNNKFSLKVINVTEANQGEYYCEILPQKIRLHTTLIVSGEPIETIIPESTKSSQESVHFKLSSTLTTFSVIGIFLFLRI